VTQKSEPTKMLLNPTNIH